nr:cleavage packaging protein [Bovine gammaherpesvirus 4]
MLLSSFRNHLQKNYEKYSVQAQNIDWPVETPVLISKDSKTNRLAHPLIGVISRINLYSPTLKYYCDEYSTTKQPKFTPDIGYVRDLKKHDQYFLPKLQHHLSTLCEAYNHVDHQAQVEFNASILTLKAFNANGVLNELKQFLINLSCFLNGCYVSKSTCIELFQKQLILHTFYFLISIKTPEETNKMFTFFKHYVGLFDIDDNILQCFKQKSTVFLIPRRHGKTWIVVAIISVLLASVENIHIGYVAHQKHVANAVFTEIITTLYQWFPSKNIEIKKENGTIIYTKPGRKPSTLMCATCFNKNSIRGQTFNILYVDEANFIKKEALPAILGFMLQKDAKIIFISSVNSADKSTSFLFNLRNAKEKMLNVVNYVCPEHKEDFNLQSTLTSCPCYRLHIPTYITIDESIKNTTNLFLDDVFTTELMGDISTFPTSSMFKVVEEQALFHFDICRVDTTQIDTVKIIDNVLYVYVDPAYTSNSEASGTGIGAVVPLKTKAKTIILGIEHFYLKNLTGTASQQIAYCVTSMIKAILTLHPHINHVNVAVEGNSSQDSAVAISTFINEYCPVPVFFAHCNERSSVFQWPIYILGSEKSQAFEKFICALNTGTLSASQTIVSNTIKISFDPVAYLMEQIRAIRCLPLKDGSYTYCAKQKTMSDDTLVAVVMANYMAISEKHTFKELCKT